MKQFVTSSHHTALASSRDFFAVPGHMFEGELTFRIDRIMPEFQVWNSAEAGQQ